MSEWKPIESAPEEGQFLVYMPGERRTPIQVANWARNVKVIGGCFHFDMPKPTHWMELPPPPQPPAVDPEPERDTKTIDMFAPEG